MDNMDFVNVFQGTGKSVMPEEGSLFSKWNLLKGKAGNVSPGACQPFGSVTCAPYSGGYSSGYGNYKPNGSAIPIEFFEGDKIIGFSHFTHSGSGAFGFYYNYLVTSPYTKNRQRAQELKAFEKETAKPGYYSCLLTEENIQCEASVSDKVAVHRYTSLNGEPLNILIDASNNGLRQNNKRLYSYSTESEIKLYPQGGVGGFVTMEGVKIYFYAVCTDAAFVTKLWCDNETLSDVKFSSAETDKKFGCVFETKETCVEIKIGFSILGEMNAMASVMSVPDFDAAVKIAEEKWRGKFNAIELYGISKEDREIFYSNFYHTLIKPCGWSKESFLWNEKGTFYLDFATLWDVYKTQIPFIFAFYPEVGRGIVKTILRFGKEKGKLFNALMLTSNMNVESTQACCLGCYVLYDAYVYGLIRESEYEDMISVTKAELEQYRVAIETDSMEKTTKLLDATLIAAAFAKVSKDLGRTKDEQYFENIAKCWTNAFGADGLLKTEYPYYEGNHWNYSFRFVPDVEKRIKLSGGKENLTKQLDSFFAFNDNNQTLDRFEGFNNETDMETPYFYHYVDRYDRIQDIVNECVSACFRTGREGLPGNNDSGGLSACYIWNFLGLFPISGQEAMFVGSPQAEKAVLHFGNDKTLTIVRKGSKKSISRVELNGEALSAYTIPVEKLLRGGTLTFYAE